MLKYLRGKFPSPPVQRGGIGVIESGDYVHVVRKACDVPTLIGFSSVNTKRGAFKPFKIYDGLEFNIILVNDAGNYWYQNGIKGVSDDSADAARRLAEYAGSIGNGKVYTFGTSMGAGGAVLVAAIAGVEAAMVFGLEPVLSGQASRSSKHLARDFVPRWRDMRGVISESSTTVYAYVSETDEADLRGAHALRDMPNVIQFSVVGCEHPGLQVFDLDRSIGGLLTEFAMYGRPTTGFARRGSLLSRWGAVEALNTSDSLRRAGDLASGLACLQTASVSFRSEPNVLAKLGNFYQAAKNEEAAFEVWNAALRLCPHHYEARTKIANYFMRRGKISDGLAHAQRAYETYPRSGHVCHSLGSALVANGKAQDAAYFFERAVKISPGNETFQKSARMLQA